MIPSDIRLFTWLDVEEVFMRIPAAEWPDWLRGVEVYWHELKVMIKPGAMEASQEWLAAAFAPRIEKAPPNLFEVFKISLETSDPTLPRLLPVAIEERAEELAEPRPKPSFERPTQVSPGIFQALSPQPFPSNTPPLIAFHSFKGGVGRTLHALALAFQIARNKKDRVLLVDADLEAPGITWLLPSRLPQPPVSFSPLPTGTRILE